tara:strand:- start:70 stop:519 length:450 start_codon:yes stop_codon:yes gene_type:complete
MDIVNKIDKEDIYDLSKIGEESLPIYYTMYHLLEILSDSSYVIFKCMLNNTIIGFAIIKIYNSKHLHVMSIAISKKYRNTGCGSKLLNHLKIKFMNHKITLYVQIQNNPAVQFYLKNGFEIKNTIENYYDELEHKDAYYCEYNPSFLKV